jgi:hypothetical protein
MTASQPHPEQLLREERQVKEFEGGIYRAVSPLNQAETTSRAAHLHCMLKITYSEIVYR